MGIVLLHPPVSRAQAGVTSGEATSPKQQITAAVLAAPDSMRAGATVLGYGADGRLTTLRKGPGGLIFGYATLNERMIAEGVGILADVVAQLRA